MNRMLMIAAAAALAVPAIAAAEPKPEAPQVDAPAATTTTAKPVTKRYCVVAQVTGSRIERRDCKTLDQWLSQGFDPRTAK